jgi:hypothetical protein
MMHSPRRFLQLSQDAAQLLQREPFANITRKLDIRADRAFKLEAPQDESHDVISTDDFHKSKVF